ncbi:MFS transporter [Natrarchaeobius halalkaliphilus]|uniref:MFS transporter n=1 Tax=Natrarchaeobius halalkaliphilus TaxID=1679091 RepID=A0A3N6LZC4_9EURY|nr:MFS transporter [Natrarchaeobius halalkaliphilus]
MLLVVALAWAAIQTGRFVLPPLLPEMRADLSLTLTQAGIVLTVFNAMYAVSQYPSGRLSDILTRATLIVPSLIVLVLGSLLIGSSTNYPLILIGAGVFGVGMGMYAIPSRALVSDLFVEHRGRALGILGAGADVGGGLAAGLAAVVLAIATWRTPFFPLAVALGGLAVLFVVWNTEPYAVERTRLGALETMRRLIATPGQRWALLAFILFYFMINGVLSFLPAYLREVKGFSPLLATVSYALLFALGIVVKPIAGGVSDRFPRRQVATAGMLVGAIALGVLLIAGSLVGVLIGIVLFAVGYKTQFPVVDALLMDAAPDGNMGGDLGAARTVFLGVGSLGPAFVGVTADRYNYTVAFAGLAVCLIVAAAILFWQGRQ